MHRFGVVVGATADDHADGPFDAVGTRPLRVVPIGAVHRPAMAPPEALRHVDTQVAPDEKAASQTRVVGPEAGTVALS